MKRLTLDETWTLCLRMWKWIVAQAKKDPDADIETFKNKWLENHGYKLNEIYISCFFCEYMRKRHGSNKANKYGCCKLCPAVKIDPKFDCMEFDCDYNIHPIAFLAKLVELNKKRLRKKRKCRGLRYEQKT